jgi:hypothetical protein
MNLFKHYIYKGAAMGVKKFKEKVLERIQI